MKIQEGKVGIFWVVRSMVVARCQDIISVPPVNGLMTIEADHFTSWDAYNMVLNTHCEYDYYPRGRVVFNTQDEKFIIYIDRCANNQRIIGKLQKYFKLQDDTYVIDESDESLKCHNCF